MKKLAFVALAVAAISQGTGCIIVDDDDTAEFHTNWNLVEDSTPVTCEEMGVTTVEFRSVDSTGFVTRDVFDCIDYAGYIVEMPLDDYYIYSIATDCPSSEPAGGACFAEGSSHILNANGYMYGIQASLDFAGEVVEVGPWTFLFSSGAPTMGNITFTVDYMTENSNCGDTASGGAAVSSQYTSLSDGSSCLAFDMDFGGNANLCGDSGTAACATCDEAVCQEYSVVQTIYDVPNGAYTLYVFGANFTGAGCYESEAIPVTVNGDVDVGVVEAPHNGESGACSYKR